MRGPEVETASRVAKIWVTTQTKKKWMRASLGRKESKGSYLGNGKSIIFITIQLEKMMIYHEIGVLLPYFLHFFCFPHIWVAVSNMCPIFLLNVLWVSLGSKQYRKDRRSRFAGPHGLGTGRKWLGIYPSSAPRRSNDVVFMGIFTAQARGYILWIIIIYQLGNCI